MRCTQLVGLREDALAWLEKHVARIEEEKCEHCGHVSGGEEVIAVYDDRIGRMHGMFDDGPDLHEFTLKDGSKVREVVQASPWSSGPVIFLCLEDEAGNRRFEWSDEEIDNC